MTVTLSTLRTIVQSLDEAIVLLEPIVGDDVQIIDTHTIFRNERAEALDERIAAAWVHSTPSGRRSASTPATRS